MLRAAFASTGRQVGWVVALATISSNLLVLFVWLLLSPGSLLPGSVRALAAEIVAVQEMLLTLPPPQRAAIAEAAQRSGLQVVPMAEPRAGSSDAVLARALNERIAERGLAARASVVAPTGSSRQGIVVTIAPEAGQGWDIAVPESRIRDVIPSFILPPATAGLLLGVPLLLVLLWIASRVTRPLGNLADAADAIVATGHEVRLPEAGTSEIRRVARAINGLLGRLRDDVAERARIMAGVSHDLRTPLTRLRLRVDAVPDAELRDRLADDVARTEAIVRASLTLLEADLRQEPAEPLDVASLASMVCDQFADAGADVRYGGPLHLVIRGQPTALERAFTNLIENACRHAGGARLTVQDHGNAVRIAVEDDGPGIPEVDLPHVTESYRRRNGEPVGFGLGLAIVASVARAHGGRLSLRNREPQGLCAELSLPVLSAA